MRPTSLGRAAIVLIVLLFAIAFVRGSVGTALAGVALAALLDGARRSVHAQHLEVSRHVPAHGQVQLDLTSTITATSAHGAPVSIRSEAPSGMRLISERSLPGSPGRLVQRLEPTSPGEHRFGPATVSLEDPWGLWAFEIAVEAPGSTIIAPEGQYLEHGRRTGRHHTIQRSVPDSLVADRTPEVRQIREYQPGDRARDLDWGISTRLGGLYTRERERAAPRKYVIFLDANRSMRRPGHVPKIRTAARIATGLVGAAEGAGVHASLVAWHEEGILSAGTAGQGASIPALLDRLGRLPAVEGLGGVRLTTDIDRFPTPAERDFLRVAAPLVGSQGATPGMEGALRTLSSVAGGRALVVCILDAEVNPRRAEVMLGRIRAAGHDVALVIPATGPHAVTRAEGTAVVDQLDEALARRKRIVHRMQSMQIPCFVAAPGDEESVIQGVARAAV